MKLGGLDLMSNLRTAPSDAPSALLARIIIASSLELVI